MQPMLVGTCLLFIFVFVGGGLWWLATRWQIRRATADIRSELSTVQAEFKRLDAEWRERDLEHPKSGPPRNGFNLNRRAEAIRGIRAGQSPERLSAGTGWSLPEVSLLVKIEQMQATWRNSS